MKFDISAFGSRIIEVITDGLYDGNINCLREYVQNGIDSKAENIKIYYANSKDLVIEDDGEGMNKDELKNCLKVGISSKDEKNVGWRGIGIWSGVSACKRLVIITKKRNDKKYRIEVDCEKLRQEYRSNKDATEILTNSTSDIEEEEASESEKPQYTIIRLESILPTQQPFFDEEKIRKYLSSMLPVPFNPKFKYSSKIYALLKKYKIQVPNINVEFNNQKIYKPPEDSKIFWDKLITKEFKHNNELIAISWILTHKINTVLPEGNKGIFFKKKGFTIGDEDLVTKRAKGYNLWQYGEIHIISDKITENAPRNNLEYTTEIVSDFLDDIGKFVNNLQMMNRYQSSKNITKKVSTLENYVKNKKIIDARKTIDSINKTLSEKTSFPKEKCLSDMKKLIDTESSRGIKKMEELESNLDGIDPEYNIKQQKELFKAFVKSFPKPLQDHLAKFSATGKLELELSVTDALVELLKQKTGLTENEMAKLSSQAYGWEKVTPNQSSPILALRNKENKDRYFGVFLYAIHDMFVNTYKHEKGMESFEWFEGLGEEEKQCLINEMYATIGLAYRLIDKSKKL